ncbi:MAG: ATPase, T2SS/T4P/T4SS family [Patescibacteria group bacterium]|jgi:twitching motility protein PilT
METPQSYLYKILSAAIKKNAILVHFSVGNRPQVKIGASYQPIDDAILEKEMAEKILNDILSDEEREQLGKDREIVAVKELEKNLRFRINIYFERNFPAFSFYHISGSNRELADCDFPESVTAFTSISSGLLVIAGSLGSGKTSTAFSFIEEINKNQAKHIVTIEETIDRVLAARGSIVEQRQVGRDAVSFRDAIKYCLKEDVDLVYINGIKDELDVCLISIMELASGNSRVILELNADSSVEIIARLVNILSKSLSAESSRYILADDLFGVIVQKLIYGRSGEPNMAAEILLANSVVKSYIREGKFQQIESVIQTSRREGMISMEKAVDELVRKGKIRKEDL